MAGTNANYNVPETPWTATSSPSLLTDYAANTTGDLSAGASFIEIVNVGTENGVVHGTPLPVGQKFTFQSYLNPVTKQFVTIPLISYDSTGTAFLITMRG